MTTSLNSTSGTQGQGYFKVISWPYTYQARATHHPYRLPYTD